MERDSHPTENNGASQPKSQTFGMLVVLGMVGTAAGFTMYTKRSSAMLKQLERIATRAEMRKPPRYIGPLTKEEWDKIRPRFDKDEFV